MKLSKWQRARISSRSGFWWTLLIYAVLYVVAEFLRPKPDVESVKPANLGDFQFPTATEDRVIPLLWGTTRLGGLNVVWYGDLIRKALTKNVQSGLWTTTDQVIGYQYWLGIQMALCRGPVDRLDGIWIGEDKVMAADEIRDVQVQRATGSGYAPGEKLTLVGGTGIPAEITVKTVYKDVAWITQGHPLNPGFVVTYPGQYTVLPTSPASVTTDGSGTGAMFEFESGTVAPGETLTIDRPELFGGPWEGQGGIEATLRFWGGGPTQGVSSYLADFQDVNGSTPAYRGTCYVAPDTEPFYVGLSESIAPWAFELRRIVNGLGLTSGHEIVNLRDANPAAVLYEIYTNTEWGMAQLPADIDTSSFLAAGDTLFTEGNGFSFLLDREMEATGLIDIIEQQISGKVFFNQVLSQWQLKLARADYDIDLIDVISESNAIEIKDFTRGSWEDTTNIVRVKFANRLNQYKDTFALAQDSANIRLQDGANISTTVAMPGVKDSTNATAIAWRTLRTLSFPLAKATFIMDRSFYATNPVDVFAFTSAKFGLNKLPMRVIKVDLGSLEDNKVTIDCVQDVFFFQLGSFGDAGGTGWTPPGVTLLPFLAAEQIAIEAPRSIVLGAPSPSLDALIMTSARRRGSETGYRIVGRNASGTPSGNFGSMGDALGFMLIGELNADLARGQTSPTTTITITNAVDTQDEILNSFGYPESDIDQASNLINLVYVSDGTNDGEFMLVQQVLANGASNVDLNTVFRGVLDTAQQAFSAGDSVYLVHVGSSITDAPVPETDNVHIKLLPESSLDLVATADAVQIAFAMDRRVRRPYCPSEVDIGGVVWASTVSLEQQGSVLDDFGFAIDFIRRDYRAVYGDEIDGLTIDAAVLSLTFPANNDTDHDMQLREDPDSGDNLLYTEVDITGTTNDQIRTAILHANTGVLPTRLRVVLTAKHDDGGDTDLTSRQNLVHDFDVTSTLTGDFELGDLARNAASAQYDVDAAVVHTVTIGTAFAGAGAGTGDVEININGGGWVQIIPQGSTSGVTASLSISDTILLRHDSTDTGDVTHVEITGSGITPAWGIFYV